MMDRDVEQQFESFSDGALLESVRKRQDEELVLGSLKELFRRKRPQRMQQAIRLVLKDPQQSLAARQVVVRELGKEVLKENEEMLLQLLEPAESDLFTPVVQSLGRIGSEAALKRLEKTSPPGDPVAQRALSFSKSLLAYRLRLNRHLLARPPASQLAEVKEGATIEINKPTPRVVKKALEDVRHDLPGLTLAESGAVRLVCSTSELILALTEEFQGSEGWQSLKERSALPFVMLKGGYSLDRYLLDTYFFVHPVEGGKELALLGTRPSGHVTYAGSMSPSGKSFVFTLRSLATRYAPAIEVEGRYLPGRHSLAVTKAITSGRAAVAENQIGTPRRVTQPQGR